MSELINPHNAEDDDVDGDLAALRSFAPRHGGTGVAWETPPTDLFARITAAVAEPEIALPAPTESTGGPDAHVAPTAEAPTAEAPAAEAPTETNHREAAPNNVSSLADRRGAPRRRFPWELAAAAAVAAIAIAAGIVSQMNRPQESLVATVALDRLAGDGSGTAELVDVDGTMQLRLDTTGLEGGDGYLEVWVIDPTVSKLVSLGPLREDGRYDVPASVDMHDFPIVDVSVEPSDGDPSHSGNSLLRGQLSL